MIMSKKTIEAVNLHFSYSDKTIFKGTSFSLNEHGFYLFLGPNGAGKTTLVKLLMGLLTPSKGKISVHSQNTQSVFGYLPQKLYFDPKFPITVEEFVLQGLLSELPLLGRWKKESKEKCRNILDSFNLMHLKHKAIGQLSGGQLQKAMAARALVNDPDIIILDEPLSGLDASSSKDILQKIEGYRGKKTIILITHVMSSFLQKADSVFLIEHGVKELHGDDLCKHLDLGLFHTDKDGCHE